MPDFLVSAATGALGPVLNKLAALLGDEYKRFKGVHGEVKFLIRELEAMHVFLLKNSEEENPDVQDKAWMKEVRELSYEIEDSLDDFKVRVDDDSAKPDGFIDKCKNLLAKTKARRRIAKELEKLKGQVKEVSERNARYKQISNTSKVTVDPRALAIFEESSRLVGIDQPKQEIISFLKKEDGDISSQQPKIVSIVGIGGIGKTTLANRVYEELKDQFECRVFFSVSRNPDIFGILRTILSEVTGQPYSQTKTGSLQQLIRKISDFLQTKRYLVVVDDVWDVKTWETIKCALPNNSCGSMIITTTRIHDVAKACCSSYGWVYHRKPLQENYSKVLFQNRIFGPGNELPEYLEEVSDKILKKCGGLPLAIIAISGLLANKARNGVHSVTEWEKVQTSIRYGLERNDIVEGMMAVLSLSYFDLPSHLKACLLYLSTFPEDYEIEKDRLVRLWVAEGFIPAESKCTLYELGEQSFTELINRNLILPKKISKWTGEVVGCRVHDTILDFIVCKSNEDNFVAVHHIPRLTPPPRIKVRRLSLQGKTEGDVTLNLNKNYANVRSIISFGFPCSLLGLRFLRVLDFTACRRSLENHHLANIGELRLLRYLSLRETSITELPEQIRALQYLETLDIRDCKISQLPIAIVGLEKLVNLLCPMTLDCLPSGIKNMQALEELSLPIDIMVLSVCVEEIGDLTKMRHLGILLANHCIIDQESYINFVKKMVSSFQRLNKLQSLAIQFSNFGEGGLAATFDGDDIILKVPWCSAGLRKLVFQMNPVSRVPGWMKLLVNLEELELRIKKLDQESLCILGDLPFLVDLILEMVNNVEGIPSTDKKRLLICNRYGYRSLRHFRLGAIFTMHFRISNMVKTVTKLFPSIPMLTFEAGSMPKLEEFHVDIDVDMTISVSNGRLDFGLKHLSQLMKVKCGMFGSKLNIWRVENAIKKALANHSKHPRFENDHHPSTEGERSNQECLRPRRHSQSTVHTTQPKAPSTADFSEQQFVQEPADDAVICTSENKTTDDNKTSGDDKMSSFTTDDNSCQSLNALPLPTDLSFTIHHHGTSLNIGRRHCQQGRQLKARRGATIRGEELVQHASVIPDGIKGTSGATPATSDVLEPRRIAAPELHGAFVPRCFTFGSGSPPNAEAEQQTKDCHKPWQRDDLANAFSSAFDGLSLGNGHPGSSATAVEVSSSDTAPSDVLGRLLIAAQQKEAIVSPCFTFSSGSLPNAEEEQQVMACYKLSQRDDLANAFNRAFDGLSSTKAVDAASSNAGAAPTSDDLGPQRIAAPQQHAIVAPCFTLSSGSPPVAETKQQTTVSYEPLQHDGQVTARDEDQANAFTSAMNGLSLCDDHPGSSAMAVEASSLDTGAAPAPSDVLGPPLLASPQQQGPFVPPCFTFSSRSPPNAEPEQQAMDCYKQSQHEDAANAVSRAFDRLSLGNDYPGPSAMAVESASSDTGTQANGLIRRILVPRRRRSSGRTAK